MNNKLAYESPGIQLQDVRVEISVCAGTQYDKPGDTMEEGGYWYEY